VDNGWRNKADMAGCPEQTQGSIDKVDEQILDSYVIGVGTRKFLGIDF
jgi:hypothetical protein